MDELIFKRMKKNINLTHLSGAVLFIPYGVTVDEFQHFVYEHPKQHQKKEKQMA